MKFDDIPGLKAPKTHLIQAVQNNRAPHSQLFFGRIGSLALPMALAYASYLHCEQRTREDSCGVCPACLKHKKHIHPDTHFIFPISQTETKLEDENAKNHALKEWRMFLLTHPFGQLDDWIQYHQEGNKQAFISREQGKRMRHMLYLKPFESRYKVIVVWMPERMHEATANGTLTLLEEPPDHSFLLFVTNDPNRLLPTVVSRMQTLQVPLLSDEDIDLFLQKKTSLDEKKRNAILPLATGNLHLALLLASPQHDHFQNQQNQFIDWMRACFKRKYGVLVELSEHFHKLGKLPQRHLLRHSADMMREALLCLAGATSISHVQERESVFITNFSRVLNIEKIEKANQLFSDAIRYLDQNGNPKMIFMYLSLQISTIINPDSQ